MKKYRKDHFYFKFLNYISTKKFFLAFTKIFCTLVSLFIAKNVIADIPSQPLIPHPPLTPSLPARVGTRTVTPEWLLSLPNLSYEYPSINWLDNTHLIYSFPSLNAKEKSQIEIINTDTREHKILSEGLIPKASPNGQWIAFIRGEGETKQLWIMNNNGTNAKQLSHVKGGLGIYPYSCDFVWSRDSKQIALEHQPFMWPWEKPRPKSMIEIIDIATGQAKQIASFEADIRYISWLSNRNEILFLKQRVGNQYNDEVDHEWVQAVNINDGHVRTIAQFDNLQQFLQPISSPNGRQVALMYDADNPAFNFMPSIGLVSAEYHGDVLPPINRLTYEIKLDSPQWSNDGQRIYVRRDYGAYKQIYAIDAKTGNPTQLTNAALNIENYSLSPDGSQLAWIGQDAQATRAIRVASINGNNVRDIAIIPGAPNDMALSEVREIDWKVTDYPIPMRGLLFLPLNYHEGDRYPLIVDIHGGDSGAHIYLMGGILMTSPLEWQMWTAKGYAVFIPEFRSSASFGSLAITRDEFQDHDRLNGDLKDIEAGVDVLIARGIVDSHRLSIIGHSAGGLRANWFTVATHRYRAIVSKEGWADEWIEALKSPPSKRLYDMFGGTPWEVPQNYLKNSAVYHSAGATTPTFFFMGNPKLGGADNYDTVSLLYKSLKAQGIETQFVKYADEGHVFEKPANRRDVLQRSIKWIDEHMNKK